MPVLLRRVQGMGEPHNPINSSSTSSLHLVGATLGVIKPIVIGDPTVSIASSDPTKTTAARSTSVRSLQTHAHATSSPRPSHQKSATTASGTSLRSKSSSLARATLHTARTARPGGVFGAGNTRPVKVVTATSLASVGRVPTVPNPKAASARTVLSHAHSTTSTTTNIKVTSSSKTTIVKFRSSSTKIAIVKPTSIRSEITFTPLHTPIKIVKPNLATSTLAEASTTTYTTKAETETASSTRSAPSPRGSPDSSLRIAATTTERVFGSNASSTKIAVVATTQEASPNRAITSDAQPSAASSPASVVSILRSQGSTTAPSNIVQATANAAESTTTERVFNPASSTKVAAVSTAAAQDSTASASSADAASSFVAAATSSSVAAASSSSVAAASSSSVAAATSSVAASVALASSSSAAAASSSPSSANTVSISVTERNSVISGVQPTSTRVGPSPSASNSAGSGSGSTINSGSASDGSNHRGNAGFFHSLPRSTSLALTALLILLLITFVGGCCGCVWMRRRRRRSRGLKLGSESGTPREKWDEKYVGARELNDDEASNPFRDDMEGEHDDESLAPEALWRRRLNRLNSSSGWVTQGPRQIPPASVTTEMSERRMSGSTWTSFDGVGTFESESELCGPVNRSRQYSNDQSVSGYSAADSSPSMSFVGEPVQRFDHRLNAPHGGGSRHPLATSFVPVTPSQYSEHSSGDDTPNGSPTALQPRTPTTPTRAALHGFDLVTLGSNSPPVPAASIRPPVQPGAWRSSLDKIMGAAVEYIASKTSLDEPRSSQPDRYTAFMAPRRAPPTPTMDSLSRSSTMSFPSKVAATMGTYGATDQMTRSPLQRSNSDGSTASEDKVELMRASHLGSARAVRTSLSQVASNVNADGNASLSMPMSMTPSRTGLGLPESIVPLEPAQVPRLMPVPPTRILVTAPSPDMPSRPYAGFAPIDDPDDLSPTSSPQLGSPKVFTPTTPNLDDNPFADHNASIDEPASPPRARANALTPSATHPIFSLVSPFAPRHSVPPSPIVEEDETSSQTSGSPASVLRGQSHEDGNESSTSEESQAMTIRARRSSATLRLTPLQTATLAAKASRRHSLTGPLMSVAPSSRRGSSSSQSSARTMRADTLSNAFTLRRASLGATIPATVRRSSSVDTFGANRSRAGAIDDDDDMATSEGSDEGSDESKMTPEQEKRKIDEMERTRRLMVERRRRSDGEVIPRV